MARNADKVHLLSRDAADDDISDVDDNEMVRLRMLRHDLDDDDDEDLFVLDDLQLRKPRTESGGSRSRCCPCCSRCGAAVAIVLLLGAVMGLCTFVIYPVIWNSTFLFNPQIASNDTECYTLCTSSNISTSHTRPESAHPRMKPLQEKIASHFEECMAKCSKGQISPSESSTAPISTKMNTQPQPTSTSSVNVASTPSSSPAVTPLPTASKPPTVSPDAVTSTVTLTDSTPGSTVTPASAGMSPDSINNSSRINIIKTNHYRITTTRGQLILKVSGLVFVHLTDFIPLKMDVISIGGGGGGRTGDAEWTRDGVMRGGDGGWSSFGTYVNASGGSGARESNTGGEGGYGDTAKGGDGRYDPACHDLFMTYPSNFTFQLCTLGGGAAGEKLSSFKDRRKRDMEYGGDNSDPNSDDDFYDYGDEFSEKDLSYTDSITSDMTTTARPSDTNASEGNPSVITSSPVQVTSARFTTPQSSPPSNLESTKPATMSTGVLDDAATTATISHPAVTSMTGERVTTGDSAAVMNQSQEMTVAGMVTTPSQPPATTTINTTVTQAPTLALTTSANLDVQQNTTAMPQTSEVHEQQVTKSTESLTTQSQSITSVNISTDSTTDSARVDNRTSPPSVPVDLSFLQAGSTNCDFCGAGASMTGILVCTNHVSNGTIHEPDHGLGALVSNGQGGGAYGGGGGSERCGRAGGGGGYSRGKVTFSADEDVIVRVGEAGSPSVYEAGAGLVVLAWGQSIDPTGVFDMLVGKASEP